LFLLAHHAHDGKSREKKHFIQNKKYKQTTASRSSDRGGDEQHNTAEGGRTHSGEAKVVDIVEEHL
jgi:hypothetical protein